LHAALILGSSGARIAKRHTSWLHVRMSFATRRSFAFSGIEAGPVAVPCQIASFLPAFLVVGPVTQDRGGWAGCGQARHPRVCSP
jgi:hypothetical protein